MLLQINFKSGKPVYLQVVDQIKAAAASGALRTGESLPSIRPLAEELRINRNTIAKAYAELENQGIIETIVGKGCFVRPNNSFLKKEVRRKFLTWSASVSRS
jgi:GntR family transcriptional regulator